MTSRIGSALELRYDLRTRVQSSLCPEQISYATPVLSKEGESEKGKLLGLIAFFQSGAAVGIFYFAGASWPAVAALAILAMVVIAMAHFITSRPI